MDQITITITREEFKKKIKDNPKGYGLIRMLHEHPEKKKELSELQLFLEELSIAIILAEVEEDLFGLKKQGAEETAPAADFSDDI